MQKPKKLFILFLVVWFVLNFIQAAFMEMMSDEAYYHLYGENLAWGYFDHPPMVGLMCFLSNLFFDGNLGVRLFTLILQIFTLIFTWKIIGEKDITREKVLLFFIISASMIMFRAYGFITAPDVPFLFFTVFFLWVYKQFLSKESWLNTLLLGLAMAGMVYSKYHAALIIGFIVLSNIKLLTKPKAWCAVGLALILLLPHIYWQFNADFPSFRYHLYDRNSTFKWSYFFEYVPNQMLVFNPFTFLALVYLFVKHKAKDQFERSLYVLCIGFFAFFWFSSFRGHVEPHWTVACSMPMIVLLYQKSLQDQKLMRYVKRWITPSLLLVLAARVILISGISPEGWGFSGKKDRSLAIETVAGDRPVIYTGSFQRPSEYHFFTKKESFVLSAVDTRQSQFDIWQKELKYQNKPAFISHHGQGRSQWYEINGRHFEGFFTENFQSVNRLKIDYTINEQVFQAGDTIVLDFEIFNPTEHDVDFYHDEFPVKWYLVYNSNAKKNKGFRFIECQPQEDIAFLPAASSVKGQIYAIIPDVSEGKYKFGITLNNTLCYAKNSEYSTLRIEAR